MKIPALVLLLAASIVSAPCHGTDATEDLDLLLLRIRNGQNGTPEAREARALDLVKSHDSPTDKGKIYSTLALIYSSHGWHGPAEGKKAIQYCEEALKYPLDPVTTVKLYVYWADNLILGNRGLKLNAQELAENRQQVVKLLLKGLKVDLDNVTEKERIPPPGVNPYHCMGGEDCSELKARYDQQWAERRRVDLQNDLVYYRGTFNRKLIDAYFPYETGVDELKTLASSILTDAHKDATINLTEGLVIARVAKERREKERSEVVFTEASTGTVRHVKKATKVRDVK